MSRKSLPLLLALGAWLAALPLMVGVHQHADWLATIDQPVIAWITRSRPAWLTQIMLGFTNLGGMSAITTLTTATVVLLCWQRRLWPALFVGLSVAGPSQVNHLLKTWLQRPRPFVADPTIQPLAPIGGYSFPSGHATAAMALGGSLIILALLFTASRRRWLVITLLTLIIGAIGLSRIYAQVHYPTDVLAGYLITFGELQLLWWLLAPKLPLRTNLKRATFTR